MLGRGSLRWRKSKGGMVGVYSVHIVGESHYQREIEGIGEGDPVRVEHEPENPHDEFAVRVSRPDGRVIGYIGRDTFVQRIVAEEGGEVSARVERIMGGTKDKPHEGVVLEVRTGKDRQDLSAELAAWAEPARMSDTGCTAWAIVAVMLPLVGLVSCMDWG